MENPCVYITCNYVILMWMYMSMWMHTSPGCGLKEDTYVVTQCSPLPLRLRLNVMFEGWSGHHKRDRLVTLPIWLLKPWHRTKSMFSFFKTFDGSHHVSLDVTWNSAFLPSCHEPSKRPFHAMTLKTKLLQSVGISWYILFHERESIIKKKLDHSFPCIYINL